MKILIVGGAGYIGTELSLHLKKEHSVSVLDVNTHDMLPLLISKKIKVYTAPVLQFCDMHEDIVSDFEAIINLTGGPDDAYPNLQDREAFCQQALANEYLREANKDARIVHVSTCYVYSSPSLSKERGKARPITAYGRSQFIAELGGWCDPNFVSLRLGTVYGRAKHMRFDTWGNWFVNCLTDIRVNFSKAIICLISMQNTIKVIEWALSKGEGIYNVADIIGQRGEVAEQFANGHPVTKLDHKPIISIGMDVSRVIKAGFKFEEVNVEEAMCLK